MIRHRLSESHHDVGSETSAFEMRANGRISKWDPAAEFIRNACIERRESPRELMRQAAKLWYKTNFKAKGEGLVQPEIVVQARSACRRAANYSYLRWTMRKEPSHLDRLRI